MFVEAGARALHARVGIDDLGPEPGDRHAERTGRGVVGLRHVDATLGGAVAVDDVATEAFREAVDVERRGFVAEPDAQGRVCVVGPSRRGEHVGERLADVVEEGHAVFADVGQETAGRESAAQHGGRARRDRRGVTGDGRVRVEQRHCRVADVVGGEREPAREVRPPAGELAVAHAHGFRGAGGTRCEDEHEHVGGGDLDVRGGAPAYGRERGFPFGRADHEHRIVGHELARALEEIEVARLGDQQRAVGVVHITRQLRAPSGRVDADQRRAARSRRRRAASRIRARCRAARPRGTARRPACARAGTRPARHRPRPARRTSTRSPRSAARPGRCRRASG